MTRKTSTTTDGGERALLARGVAGGDEAIAKQELQALQADEERWTAAGAVTPRFAPDALLRIVDRSSILPQCIEAMANGIDGWGHTFEPRIDLAKPDADEQIRAALVLEREADAREAARAEGKTDWESNYDIAATDVAERRAILERQLPIQRFRAEAWFESAATGAPWVELRRRVRSDQYAVGHGCLEVARDETGDPAQIGHMAAHTVLPLARRPPVVSVDVEIPVSQISTRTVKRAVQFAIYVQQVGSEKRYFKEFGDPRIVSQATGKIYKSISALHKAEDKRAAPAVPATELLYLPLYSPMAPTAGQIPWAGQTPNVLGLRAAEETNFAWFDDRCVPPGAWLIIGGVLDEDLRSAMENHLRVKVKGRANAYRPLVIEVKAPSGARGEKVEQPKITWMSFREDIQKDATHQKYQADARDAVRSAFRLPRILTGDVQADLTRANAYASLEFANTHVFTAPRNVFDWTINTTIMPALGVSLWKFVSRGPDLADAETLATVTDVLAERGGLTPRDVRAVAARALPVPLEPFPEEANWARQPLALTLAGFAAEQVGAPADQAGRDLLTAFGPDGTPEKRAVATGIFKQFFARAGYELVRIGELPPDAPER